MSKKDLKKPTPTKRPAYPGDRILRAEEVAQITQSGLSTVFKWMAEGTLPSVRIGGARRIWESALHEKLQDSAAA